MVHDDCVGPSASYLHYLKRQDEVTATEIDRLVCVPIDDAEEEELLEEIAWAAAVPQPISVPKIRTINIRLHSLRAGAAPGPSGWRKHLENRRAWPWRRRSSGICAHYCPQSAASC